VSSFIVESHHNGKKKNSTNGNMDNYSSFKAKNNEPKVQVLVKLSFSTRYQGMVF